jgi:hypothetical protein
VLARHGVTSVADWRAPVCKIDSDAFAQGTGFVALGRYGVAVLHKGRSA